MSLELINRQRQAAVCGGQGRRNAGIPFCAFVPNEANFCITSACLPVWRTQKPHSGAPEPEDDQGKSKEENQSHNENKNLRNPCDRA